MMQCKDIDDIALLRFIDRKQHELKVAWNFPHLPWVCVWDLEPPYSELPGNLFRAKMTKLIHRGWLDGCTCGCRGDYELTPAGRARLTEVSA